MKLTKYERKIIIALAVPLIPLTADSKELPDLTELIDEHVGRMTPDMALLFRISLWIMKLGGFLRAPRLIKRYLETIIFMNYYSIPSAFSSVCGYTPKFKPPVEESKIDLSRVISPESDLSDEADVCVIGSGAGGAVAAAELALKGHSVIILEEGEFYGVENFGSDAVSMVKMLYRGGGVTNTFGRPPIIVPMGMCVGGTTVVNSGTCLRTPDHIFDKWVNESGLQGWTPSHMKSHYEAVEKVLEIEEAKNEVQGRSGVFFEKGLKLLGHNLVPIMRNAPNCRGSGVCCFGCPTNAKRALHLNYIPKALEAGAKIYTACRVLQIVYKNGHAVMARGRIKNGRSSFNIKAKVFIAASGALGTPVLLLRSRVPDISGKIGHNLSLHPAAKVTALFDDEVRGWDGIPQGYRSDALKEEGIALEGIFLPPPFLASTILLMGKEHHEVMKRYNNLAIFGMMVSDTSRGRVLPGLHGHPMVIYNVNTTDLPKYYRGIKFLADAFFKAGAKKVFLPIHTLPQLTSKEWITPIIELKPKRSNLDLQAFHPMGTCAMGADPSENPLDPSARLYGIDNLFVADASIFPTSLGVNPMLTIMAAAHKITDFIHRDVL